MDNLSPALATFLTDNDLDFEEVSDIILKYGRSNDLDDQRLQFLRTEISNYARVKRDISSFPTELQDKVLQYARDTAHIGVGVDKIKQQIRNELSSIERARADIDKVVDTMNKMQGHNHTHTHTHTHTHKHNEKHNNLEVVLAQFIDSVDCDLQKQSDSILKNDKRNKNRRLSSRLLAIMDSRRSAEIGVRTLVDHFTTENNLNDGVAYNILCTSIGKEIERDLFLANKLSSSVCHFLGRHLQSSANKVRFSSKLGIKIGDSFDQRNIVEIGGLLVDSILRSCTLSSGDTHHVFVHATVMAPQHKHKSLGVIKCDHRELAALLQSTLRYRPSSEIHPVAQPMVVPPRPWKNVDEGPFFYYNESFMRYIDYKNQYKPLRLEETQLRTLLQSINILQSTAWKINRRVLDAITHLYEHENGNVAGLPNKLDHALPTLDEYDSADADSMRRYQHKKRVVAKMNAEEHSLRCDLMLRVNLARQLCSESEIYFPLNIDFRGRIYPISPHINHIGNDVVRGMMLFAKGKKLGSRGWFWLNVNLANKFGFDKAKNAARFRWALEHKTHILDVCRDPLQHRWWLEADSPFQALSICLELGAVYRLVDEEGGCVDDYDCCLPIGQDGSCNGLQHYAAMLRDEKMAQFVNVANNDLYDLGRGDVYSEVNRCVQKMIADDVANVKSKAHEFAKLLQGKITRKIVKQTVMTSVYGVTEYGAKRQIKRWLLAAIEDGHIALPTDVYSAEGEQLLAALAMYVSKYTLYAIGLTNTPAYLSMLWLKNCASLIAKNGFRVSWITPMLQLPCTQHYCDRTMRIATKQQTVSLTTHSSDNKKDINVLKQSSAFPPNFIHSLDATHCLLTARQCYLQHGLTFASIHDSFWTHACDVDIMSKVLRQQFINLYDGPSMLQQLYQTFCVLYPEIDFAPPPNRSDFDLQQVKDSEW
eukprot:CAMPEP_0202689872 /NCGR_PEP_ID=MMETSP1385-20130828/5048_1 /ASSEMBLY_ACC=CAM_ASM_000861 /TAXON_ID=933848 /ORGANISM="Elphidium margaritaceum" /LENGTH=931 /DNA_ID=CAMNT_0049345083 /DNA_START=240 /DNA_END=3032 /DNA_ORIENTATION=+